MTIIDKLKDVKRLDLESGGNFKIDSQTYKKLVEYLPKRFPCPDSFYTRKFENEFHDAAFCYYLQSGEKAEPLRMLLTMVFGATKWEGHISKKDKMFFLTSSVQVKDLIILLLLEANPQEYNYSPKRKTPQGTYGTIELKRFIPYDIKRDLISPVDFESLQMETALSSVVFTWWIDLLDILIESLDPNFPIPTDLQGTFREDYDINFIYNKDVIGTIKNNLDMLVPNLDWILTWNKQTGEYHLNTLMALATKKIPIKIQIIIRTPAIHLMKLNFLSENSNFILYKVMAIDE